MAASAGDIARSAPATAASYSGVSQTAIMFACMFIGFLVYITCRGQLANYLALFVGNPPSSNPAPPVNGGWATPQQQQQNGGFQTNGTGNGVDNAWGDAFQFGSLAG